MSEDPPVGYALDFSWICIAPGCAVTSHFIIHYNRPFHSLIHVYQDFQLLTNVSIWQISAFWL